MLRIYFLQQWYSLSDDGLGDALYDSSAMRAFAGIDLAVEKVPNATKRLKFRRLPLEHDLTRKLFDGIGISPCERGLMMKEDTLVWRSNSSEPRRKSAHGLSIRFISSRICSIIARCATRGCSRTRRNCSACSLWRT